jgi:hypothetical protein
MENPGRTLRAPLFVKEETGHSAKVTPDNLNPVIEAIIQDEFNSK